MTVHKLDDDSFTIRRWYGTRIVLCMDLQLEALSFKLQVQGLLLEFCCIKIISLQHFEVNVNVNNITLLQWRWGELKKEEWDISSFH